MVLALLGATGFMFTQDHDRARARGGRGRALRHPERPALRHPRLYPPLHRADLRAHQGHARGRGPSSRSSASAASATPASTSGCSRTGPSATRSQSEIQQDIQGRLGKVAGVEAFVFSPPSLPGSGGGLPISVVIQSIHDPSRVYEVAEEVKQKAQASGRFIVVQNSLAFDAPQVTMTIDRDRAASLNVPISDIGSTLGLLVGGGSVGQFDRDFEQLRHHHPGAAGVPRQPRGARPVLRPRRDRRDGAAVLGGHDHDQRHRRPRSSSSTSSTRRRSRRCRCPASPPATASPRSSGSCSEVLPEGFFIDYSGQSRLEVQQGNTIADRLRAGDPRDLSRARRPVRELPRPASSS